MPAMPPRAMPAQWPARLGRGRAPSAPPHWPPRSRLPAPHWLSRPAWLARGLRSRAESVASLACHRAQHLPVHTASVLPFHELLRVLESFSAGSDGGVVAGGADGASQSAIESWRALAEDADALERAKADVTGVRRWRIFAPKMDASQLLDGRYKNWKEVLAAGVPPQLTPSEALQWRQEVDELMAIDEAVRLIQAECGLLQLDEAGPKGSDNVAQGKELEPNRMLLLSRLSKRVQKLPWHQELSNALLDDLRGALGICNLKVRDSNRKLRDAVDKVRSTSTNRGSFTAAVRALGRLVQTMDPSPYEAAERVVFKQLANASSPLSQLLQVTQFRSSPTPCSSDGVPTSRVPPSQGQAQDEKQTENLTDLAEAEPKKRRGGKSKEEAKSLNEPSDLPADELMDLLQKDAEKLSDVLEDGTTQLSKEAERMAWAKRKLLELPREASVNQMHEWLAALVKFDKPARRSKKKHSSAQEVLNELRTAVDTELELGLQKRADMLALLTIQLTVVTVISGTWVNGKLATPSVGLLVKVGDHTALQSIRGRQERETSERSPGWMSPMMELGVRRYALRRAAMAKRRSDQAEGSCTSPEYSDEADADADVPQVASLDGHAELDPACHKYKELRNTRMQGAELWGASDKVLVGAYLLSLFLPHSRLDVLNSFDGENPNDVVPDTYWDHGPEFTMGVLSGGDREVEPGTECERDDTGRSGLAFRLELSRKKESAKKRAYYVTASKPALKKLLGVNDIWLRESAPAEQGPMLVPPLMWVAQGENRPPEGGFFHIDCPLFRQRDGNELMDKRVMETSDGLQIPLRAMNAVACTRWRINPRVLELIHACERGKSFNAPFLPPLHELQEPLVPEDDPETGRPTAEAMRAYRKTRRDVQKRNFERFSLWCSHNLTMAAARKYANDTFFFSYNFDFRGRAYANSPYLSPLGDDNCRGLLLFDEGKPLGAQGLYWLKMHLPALWGASKMTSAERLSWAETRIAEGRVRDVAMDPLGAGRPWLFEAESPMQLFALCSELHAAVTSDNPSSFISHVPVHQDGSCNGLQHYAALGRDEAGARQVNVLPGDKPGDVYSAVSEVVSRKIDQDAAAGVEHALWLQGKVGRKTVKQVVMTSVYGVTLVGARDQARAPTLAVLLAILPRILLKSVGAPSAGRSHGLAGNSGAERRCPLSEDLSSALLRHHKQIYRRLQEAEGLAGVETETLKSMAMYCAKLTLASLGEVQSSATDIMGWLNECAREIARKGEPVEWISPLGIPIVQPYRKNTSVRLQTILQGVSLNRFNDINAPINKRKQAQAFPPNYIHSLDSSHMMLTAIGCQEAGITFASVHDSFWTHASDVSRMGEILREKFIDLHERRLMDELHEFFRHRYPTIQWDDEKLKPPRTGSLDLHRVRDSAYFFS